mmetsp:Transcript_45294/g.108005  ORF Transcript_45294/g.108005 Transcript_45294/m.108005 type:complete len:137 (-) Transcript_45294:166-576(-)
MPGEIALQTPLRGKDGLPPTSPDASQLVDRLQALKARLASMTRTLEDSVSAASPVRTRADEEVVYTTPKLMHKLLQGPLAADARLFVAENERVGDGEHITEVRFTLAASSAAEADTLIAKLTKGQVDKPPALNLLQ